MKVKNATDSKEGKEVDRQRAIVDKIKRPASKKKRLTSLQRSTHMYNSKLILQDIVHELDTLAVAPKFFSGAQFLTSIIRFVESTDVSELHKLVDDDDSSWKPLLATYQTILKEDLTKSKDKIINGFRGSLTEDDIANADTMRNFKKSIRKFFIARDRVDGLPESYPFGDLICSILVKLTDVRGASTGPLPTRCQRRAKLGKDICERYNEYKSGGGPLRRIRWSKVITLPQALKLNFIKSKDEADEEDEEYETDEGLEEPGGILDANISDEILSPTMARVVFASIDDRLKSNDDDTQVILKEKFGLLKKVKDLDGKLEAKSTERASLLKEKKIGLQNQTIIATLRSGLNADDNVEEALEDVVQVVKLAKFLKDKFGAGSLMEAIGGKIPQEEFEEFSQANIGPHFAESEIPFLTETVQSFEPIEIITDGQGGQLLSGQFTFLEDQPDRYDTGSENRHDQEQEGREVGDVNPPAPNTSQDEQMDCGVADGVQNSGQGLIDETLNRQ